ncbi:transposase, partial [Brevibacillus agri]|nr:transposase [Brevibacillus agri]MBG9565287.1 transposase [Brevibacillus agri]MBG9567257.1 transposase [Brevibacillus agri]MBG9568038.1 transposase [Brevibacillus agri]
GIQKVKTYVYLNAIVLLVSALAGKKAKPSKKTA